MNLIDTAIEAARAAGSEIMRRLPEERDVRSKGFRDIVTDADLAAQATLASIIHTQFPQHGILSEEGLTPGDETETVWVLDPVDGTTNYEHRFPAFAVSVGIMHNGTPIAGVVFDPLHERLFCAERGAGATLNGLSLRVNTTDELIQAVVGMDFPREPGLRAEQMQSMVALSKRIRTFRSLGSSALAMCFVAAGWMEGYLHFSLAPWDCAAAGLILQEAGGMLTGHTGEKWQYTAPRCLASNGRLHPALLEAIKV